MTRFHRLAIILQTFFLICLCSACATNTPVAEDSIDPSLIQARDNQLQALERWRAHGGLQIESDQAGEQSVQFAWDNRTEGVDLRLFGPLGKQAFRVWDTGLVAQLQSQDEPAVYGNSVDELLETALGLIVPVSQMRRWAVGLADENAQVSRDALGRLRDMTIDQAGSKHRWRVQYPRYRRISGLRVANQDSIETINIDLPVEMLISSEGVEIAVSIRKWSQPGQDDSNRLVIPAQAEDSQ